MQVLPLDAMCGSVKKSVTEAFQQHLTVIELANETLKQQDRWPAAIAESCSHLHGDLVIPSSPAMKPPRFQRSVSSGFAPLPSETYGEKDTFGREEPGDSDSSSEGIKLHRFGRKLGGLNRSQRLRSLPVENHMSTQDLLSAGQRSSSSSDIRLDIAP